ncbi:MAG: hypothetical protein ACRDZX_17015, partial [Acidimicrobiales bacterium]
GYGVVRSAMRALLDRRDRGKPLGALGPELLQAVGMSGLDNLADEIYKHPHPGRWAAYAPVVLGSNDPVSTVILDETARALGYLVDAALEKLSGPPDPPIVLAGGMTEGRLFRSGVTSFFRRTRPASAVSFLQEPPVAGAVELARRALAGPLFGGAKRLR